jgi:hypothetical protein
LACVSMPFSSQLASTPGGRMPNSWHAFQIV